MELILNATDIENKIYTFLDKQVMLDKDLSALFQTDTRTLKQAVRRNIERFPQDFMFELSEDMINQLVSQSVIPSKSNFGGAKPFAFTEQGIAMLSSVIKTPFAVQVSLKIIRVFVQMRKMMNENRFLLERIMSIERKQLESDQKFELVFSALDKNKSIPQQGIFFEGQIFDAYSFVSDIIRSAKHSIQLIDNYIDDTVLTLLVKREKNVSATIYTQKIDKKVELDVQKHNQQYPHIKLSILDNVHDRFLLIDEKELYHIGASLKDLGKKWFAFSKMNDFTTDILKRMER
jgi:hypothetical protein